MDVFFKALLVWNLHWSIFSDICTFGNRYSHVCKAPSFYKSCYSYLFNFHYILQKYLDQAEQPSPLITEGCLLSKVPILLNKARTLCKDTITNTGYPSLVQSLDDFVTLVIETSSHLGSLEVWKLFYCYRAFFCFYFLYFSLNQGWLGHVETL